MMCLPALISVATAILSRWLSVLCVWSCVRLLFIYTIAAAGCWYSVRLLLPCIPAHALRCFHSYELLLLFLGIAAAVTISPSRHRASSEDVTLRVSPTRTSHIAALDVVFAVA